MARSPQILLMILIMICFRHIHYFIIVFAYAIPVFVPWYFWNESLLNSHLVPFILTTTVSKHITFTVNSVAHLYGMKPYNR